MRLADQAGLPSHFKIKKLKYISYIKGRIGWQNLRSEEFTDQGPYLITGMHFKEGRVDWGECYHVSPERYAIDTDIHVREGDVLITKDGSIGKLAYIDALPGPACLNSHLLIVRPRSNREYVGRFLYYMLQSPLFSRFVLDEQSGTTFYGISQESIENFPAFYPPDTKEQSAIADFLDRETAKLDGLITKKQRLHSLLDAVRLTVISDAVSGGSAFRSSQSCPAVRLRYLLHRIEQGWSPECETRPADPGEWGVMKAGCVKESPGTPWKVAAPA